MSFDIVSSLAGAAVPSALVTVVSVKGSSPRHPGAKMIVRADGSISGTVGGGKGEAAAIERARVCLGTGKSALISVEMLGAETEGSEMICGGVSTMLVESVADPDPYRAAQSVLAGGRRAVLSKTFGPPSPDGTVEIRVALLERPDETPALSAAFSRGKASLSESASGSVFLDPLFPEERLLILGAGHVGKAVADFAAALDFSVTVVDDRPEFFAEGRFLPSVRTISGPFAAAIDAFPFDPATYAIVVTRGHLFDLECARALMPKEYRYAGIIGSSRKIGMLLDQLASDGFPPEKIASLRAPIGLDIAAETPAEIAAAIAAELVAVRRDAPLVSALEEERRRRRSGSFGA